MSCGMVGAIGARSHSGYLMGKRFSKIHWRLEYEMSDMQPYSQPAGSRTSKRGRKTRSRQLSQAAHCPIEDSAGASVASGGNFRSLSPKWRMATLEGRWSTSYLERR